MSESWRTDRPPVLVVSDDPDAGELLGRLLERDGWPIELAISGAAGLTSLCDAQSRYAIVVVELEASSAMQLLASIRDTPGVDDTRVIVCAGPRGDRGSAWIAGTDGYLVHPFDASHFLAEVAAVAARPEAERDARIEELVLRYLDGRSDLFEYRIRRGKVRDGHGDLLARYRAAADAWRDLPRDGKRGAVL